MRMCIFIFIVLSVIWTSSATSALQSDWQYYYDGLGRQDKPDPATFEVYRDDCQKSYKDQMYSDNPNLGPPSEFWIGFCNTPS